MARGKPGQMGRLQHFIMGTIMGNYGDRREVPSCFSKRLSNKNIRKRSVYLGILSRNSCLSRFVP